MEEIDIDLPDGASTEWSEDVVLRVLDYAFSEFGIDDILVTKHRLSKVDRYKDHISELGWEKSEYNGMLMITKTIGESECIVYFDCGDMYRKQSLLKELEMYVNNTFTNIEAHDNQTEYECLYIQPESDVEMFTLGL